MANFLFVLRSNDNEKATRCFQFAKIAHSKNHKVNIFLIDGGVDWAIKGRDGSHKNHDRRLRQRLPAISGRK